MKFNVTVEIEVSDSVAGFMGAGSVAQSLASALTKSVRSHQDENPDIISHVGDVVVTTPQGAQHSLGWSTSAPKEDHTAAPSAPRSSGGMSGGARKTSAPKKHMGRPKTLTDMEASDGKPVREWGERSPESLQAAGIEVRKVGAPWPSERRAARTENVVQQPNKSAGKSGGMRPPVMSKRRGA